MAQRSAARELDVEALRRECPPDELGLRSTADAEPLDGPLGEERPERFARAAEEQSADEQHAN